MIQVTIDGKGYEYPENCSYYEIAKDFEKTMDAPIVLVKVDGRLRELHKQLKKDCELEFVTTKDEIGHKTYQRSLSLLLVKAVYHVGGYDKIRHVMLHFSAGSGFFYTVDGDITLNQEFLDEVKAYMHEQVEKAVPIYKRSVDTHEARERFRLHGMTDKDRLFRYRRVSRVNLYSLGDFEDYYYGYMVPSAGYLKYFKLYLYDEGFVIQMPVMNGYEATRVIRALTREDAGTVPIIAMTANAFAEDIAATSAAGMDAHVSKPIDPEKLAKVLAKVMR